MDHGTTFFKSDEHPMWLCQSNLVLSMTKGNCKCTFRFGSPNHWQWANCSTEPLFFISNKDPTWPN